MYLRTWKGQGMMKRGQLNNRRTFASSRQQLGLIVFVVVVLAFAFGMELPGAPGCTALVTLREGPALFLDLKERSFGVMTQG
jgi:hypothetical protein